MDSKRWAGAVPVVGRLCSPVGLKCCMIMFGHTPVCSRQIFPVTVLGHQLNVTCCSECWLCLLLVVKVNHQDETIDINNTHGCELNRASKVGGGHLIDVHMEADPFPTFARVLSTGVPLFRGNPENGVLQISLRKATLGVAQKRIHPHGGPKECDSSHLLVVRQGQTTKC